MEIASMSVGTGIFLGAVYLGTVYLYSQTRDRWDWSRVTRRGAVLLAIAAVAAAVAFGAQLGYDAWRSQPRVVDSVEGIRIGEPWADVVLRYGKFKSVPIKSVKKYPDQLQFAHETLPVSVFVHAGAVHYVVFSCQSSRHKLTLNGVSCGDDERKLTSTFGKRLRVMCSKAGDSNLAVYDVTDFGTRYVVGEKGVVAISVAEPSELASFRGLNWEICSPGDSTSPALSN
jgi:hypothetical protein